MERLKAPDLPHKADIVFAVNSFCYASNINRLLKNLHEYTAPRAKLVIIDSQPSAFWDKTSAASYSLEEWQTMLRKNNWRVERTFLTGIYRLWNIPIMGISQALLCTKATESKPNAASSSHRQPDSNGRDLISE